MISFDPIPALPHMIIGATAVVIMLSAAFQSDSGADSRAGAGSSRRSGAALLLTLVGLTAALAALWHVSPRAPRPMTDLMVFDPLSIYFTGLAIGAGIFAALLSSDIMENKSTAGARESRAEYYILLTLAVFGASVLAAANHFAAFFLGLEILSVSLYALIAFRRDSRGIEAGVKYLVLASVSSAFLLFGMALIYAGTGTLSFPGLAAAAASGSYSIVLVSGAALTLIGIGFKLGVFPFHMWTPDVYEGAPAPVSAFIATASKGVVFAVLLRYFTRLGFGNVPSLETIIWIISVLSMFAGNLLALFQPNIKRVLAYSSIAHLGYLLVAFLAGGKTGAAAVSFYFAAYFTTMLGAFSIIALLSADRDPDRPEADQIEDYRGLFYKRPAAAGVFTLMLLSLAGIPLTAGFIGKFYIIAAGAASSLWLLVVILAVNSGIAIFYYLRIVLALYEKPARAEALQVPLPVGGAVIAVLCAILLWLGIYPEPLLRIVRLAANF